MHICCQIKAFRKLIDISHALLIQEFYVLGPGVQSIVSSVYSRGIVTSSSTHTVQCLNIFSVAWALASHFKVMGKALTGKLSCTGTGLVNKGIQINNNPSSLVHFSQP